MFKTILRSVPASICCVALAATFALALSVTAADAATPSGGCISAHIDAPFRLPDGSLHPAATLTFCGSKAFSPVASVHRTYVDGRPVGMFLSHTRRGESTAAAAPSVLFQRDGDGPLDLLGYVLPTEGRDVAYQLRMGRFAAAAASGVAAATAPIAVAFAAK